MVDNFMAGLQQGANDDANSIGRALVENLAELVRVFDAFLAAQGTTGLFTMTATASLVVLDPAVLAGSTITLQAVNAAAAVLQGSNESLYISAKTAGTSFTVATGAGTNAAGGEIFSYRLTNP